MDDWIETRELDANHEAGHAVVAAHRGSWVRHVQIAPCCLTTVKLTWGRGANVGYSEMLLQFEWRCLSSSATQRKRFHAIAHICGLGVCGV